jgi:hypothetical protein
MNKKRDRAAVNSEKVRIGASVRFRKLSFSSIGLCPSFPPERIFLPGIKI